MSSHVLKVLSQADATGGATSVISKSDDELPQGLIQPRVRESF